MLNIQKNCLIFIVVKEKERKKIKKCNKFVCNIHDKENYVERMRALKQALNHGLILKNLKRVIQLNREVWLKR